MKCPQLAATRTTVVFGSGNANADLMFVGEAPGANEDKQGLPFVGQAGRLLDTLLGEIGLTRGDVFVCNVLKCRPPGNRDPLPQEIDACQDYLWRQLELIEPNVVCTLGNFATKLLRADPTGITRLHGRAEERMLGPRRVRLYPLFHPAAALYTPSMLETLRADFQRDPAAARAGRAGAARAGSEEPARAGARAGDRAEPERVPLVYDEQLGSASRRASEAASRPRGVLVGGDRVALVVAPLAADQQVARREALQAEAGAAGERDRGLVAGLDVRLDAVQAERAERVVEDLLERLAHQALAGVALVGVVAEVGGLEGAADDLGDREHARDLAVVGAAGEQAEEVLAARAAVELVELVGALGRVGPRPVQPVALAGEREELRPVLAGEHAQAHAGARRRVGGEDVGGADDVTRSAAKDGAFHGGCL